jgi:hypothetical protein
VDSQLGVHPALVAFPELSPSAMVEYGTLLAQRPAARLYSRRPQAERPSWQANAAGSSGHRSVQSLVAVAGVPLPCQNSRSGRCGPGEDRDVSESINSQLPLLTIRGLRSRLKPL